MSPWAKRMLVAAMLVWSALTVGAGWYALRGGGPASAADRGAQARAEPASVQSSESLSASAASRLRAARTSDNPSGDSGSARTSADSGVAPTAVARLHPDPVDASQAGGGPKVQSLNPDGPRNTPPPNAGSKGVIVLDPGHGRGDPGATHYLPDGSGRWDITEAKSNQQNAELLRDDLTAMGYEVYLTRDGEGQGPGAPLPLQFITSDLYARVGLAKAVDANLYLAIHGNGASVPFLSGPETWYCGRHEAGAANEKLALLVQQAMMDALHEYGYFPPDRGVKEDAQSHHSGDFCQFVVTRESPVPAALLEFLFLSNDDDARVLVDDRSHVLMAKHVAEAIDQFMRERAANP